MADKDDDLDEWSRATAARVLGASIPASSPTFRAFQTALRDARIHRHHTPPQGHKFSVGAALGDMLVGVVIVGRPVARGRQDGRTLEVTRLATDGTPNACSFLYGAARRATFALGYTRLGTYILAAEPGTSLRAAGWKLIGEVRGGRRWDTPSRPRSPVDQEQQPKLLFEVTSR